MNWGPNYFNAFHWKYVSFLNGAIDIADPSSRPDACHKNLVMDLAHRRVSEAQ